jgi:hypothetical protein
MALKISNDLKNTKGPSKYQNFPFRDYKNIPELDFWYASTPSDNPACQSKPSSAYVLPIEQNMKLIDVHRLGQRGHANMTLPWRWYIKYVTSLFCLVKDAEIKQILMDHL